MSFSLSSYRWAGRATVTVGALAAVGALAFFYTHMQVPHADEHARLQAELSRLELLETSLDARVLEARFGLSGSYDPVAQTDAQLREVRNSVARRLANLYPDRPAELFRPLEAYSARLAEKRDRIDRFKTENAVLDNSARYFPTVAAMAERATGDSALSRLRSATLTYLATTSPDDARRLDEAISDAAKRLPDYSGDARRDAGLAVAHARAIARSSTASTRLLHEAADVSAIRQGKALAAAYRVRFEAQERQAGVYRLMLFSLCLKLLGSVAFFVLRLRASAAALRREQNDLERRVLERTSEVTQARENLESLLIQLRSVATQVKYQAEGVATNGRQLDLVVGGATESDQRRDRVDGERLAGRRAWRRLSATLSLQTVSRRRAALPRPWKP